ncbi:MAG TPA: cyclase family protein [Nitrososphaerales archaeon]
MQLIDLTMSLNDSTPVYFNGKRHKLNRIAHLGKDGWNEFEIHVSNHYGTHIDAPWHMVEDGRKLGDYPIERFVGRGVLCDVRYQKVINSDLEEVCENDILLLRTDYTKHINSAEYSVNNPVLSMKLAEQIVGKKIRMVGIDSFSPDNNPYEIHKYLLKHDVLILENLVNLDLIPINTFTLYVLALKLDQVDGAPCRVIAQIE